MCSTVECVKPVLTPSHRLTVMIAESPMRKWPAALSAADYGFPDGKDFWTTLLADKSSDYFSSIRQDLNNRAALISSADQSEHSVLAWSTLQYQFLTGPHYGLWYGCCTGASNPLAFVLLHKSIHSLHTARLCCLKWYMASIRRQGIRKVIANPYVLPRYT